MANSLKSKDGLKRAIYLILIFGGFAILRNFVPSGLDQAGWDGFLVLFVAVLLWLTEAVPMAITAIFVLFFGAWVGFEAEGTVLAGFSGTGTFFLLGAMVIGQIFTKVGLGKRISLYLLPMFGNKPKAVLLAVMLGTCVVSMFLADIPTALIFFSICTPLLEQNGCMPGKSKFGKAIMLGIPVGAAVGGIGMLVLLSVINLVMKGGPYPMPQGVTLTRLCLSVVGALAKATGCVGIESLKKAVMSKIPGKAGQKKCRNLFSSV